MSKTKSVVLGLLATAVAASAARAIQSACSPQESADGSVLVMATDTQILVFDGSGNQTNALPLAAPVTQMALSPNGAVLAFADGNGVFWVENLGTAVKAQVSAMTSPLQKLGNLRWSPTSASLTFTIAQMQQAPPTFTIKQISLYMVNADGSGSKLVTSYNPAP